MATSRAVGAVVTMSCLVLGSMLVATHRLGADTVRDQGPIPPREMVNHVPDPRVLRVVSMGHHEAMADLMWLNALSFFGKHFGVRKDPTWLWPHLDAITTLDPNFSLVYEWAGTVVVYGGEITNESVMVSNEVLERGIERFPLRWELWMMLGVNYANELRPTTPEEEAEWSGRASEAFERAASLPGAPWFLRGTALAVAQDDQDLQMTASTVTVGLVASEWEVQANAMRGIAMRRLPTPIRLRVEAHEQAANRLLESPRWVFNSGLLALAVHPAPMYVETAPYTSP